MENKLLITQALDERDLLVKKINSKIVDKLFIILLLIIILITSYNIYNFSVNI